MEFDPRRKNLGQSVFATISLDLRQYVGESLPDSQNEQKALSPRFGEARLRGQCLAKSASVTYTAAHEQSIS
jgi:hypothetical protein